MNQTRLNVFLKCLLVIAFAHAADRAAGDELIRRQGRFIHLTTDLASADEAETLVASFDAAVPQWARLWNLPDDALENWTVDACVIRDRAEFQRQGLIPPEVPEFPFGYALGNRVWVLAQQSEYYTRHLLLHEGVHSLAFSQFDGAGPSWYQEGTAELLATHAGAGPTTEINRIPTDRDQVPYWGRFKRMNQSREQATVPTFSAVLGYQPDLRGDVETYGWSWAATMMLYAYPEYRGAFLAAARRGKNSGPKFNRTLQNDLKAHWPILAARWRLMCHDLDYGFDWSREQVNLSASDPKWNGKPIDVQVSPSRGWQSIGVRIPGRIRVRVAASGRISLADAPKPWISEPPGITFQYHRGRPLGELQAIVLPNAFDPQAKSVQPITVLSIPQETTLDIQQYSWLLLRVNDGLGELGDNTGQYSVRISHQRS